MSHKAKPTRSSVSSVPAEKVIRICPDCPTYFGADDEEVRKTLTLSLEKFNKESGVSKHFALLKFHRALVSVSFHFLPCSYGRCWPTSPQLEDNRILIPGSSHQTLLISHVMIVRPFQVFVHLWTKADVVIHVFPVCLPRWASLHFTV